MSKCSTMDCCHLEQQIIDFITDSPRSSIDEIAEFLDVNRVVIYRLVEGRPGSKSIIGLVSAGILRPIPGINYRNNRLVWLYEINNS